jgi:ribosomal protein S18 acetylase RimI-like enzyme
MAANPSTVRSWPEGVEWRRLAEAVLNEQNGSDNGHRSPPRCDRLTSEIDLGRATLDMKIRQMMPADAAEVFALRRRALLDVPLAFLSSPEDDLAQSVEIMRGLLDRAPDSIVLGAESGQLIGMLGVYRAQPAKAAHKANFWGMYVVPEHRGTGIGRALLRSALAHARSLTGIASVHLSVAETAEAARHLYETEGFSVWGTEPDAIRHERDAVTEYHMRLVLD